MLSDSEVTTDASFDDQTKTIEQVAIRILKQSYGPDAEYRDGQLEAIVQAASAKKALVVQKTGWGKSLVYFVATKFLRENGAGPTIIISPLLALMNNQIDAASQLGLSVITINSSNKDDWESLYANINSYDALIVSPERLSDFRFMEELSHVRNIKLFVVDEAHCISDWGHDFRPDYQRVSSFIKKLPAGVGILGTTATANDRVINDIRTQLGGDLAVVRGKLMRENLAIQVNPSQSYEERLAWLATTLGANGALAEGQGLVYCKTHRDVEYVLDYLKRFGISAAPYYSEAAKSEAMDQALLDFATSHVRVLVCTVKLGMGYDKSDIRFVINFQLPDNIISYYQQIGRAGRDGKLSYAVLLHGPEDESILRHFIDSAFTEPDLLANLLERAGDGASFTELQSELNVTNTKFSEALKYLQVHEYLDTGKRGGRLCYFRNESATFDPEAERARQAALATQRYAELEHFKSFLTYDGCSMKFIADELDAPDAKEKCGICAHCKGHTLVPEEPTPDLVADAKAFLYDHHGTIAPRKQWGNRKRIVPDEQYQPGWALTDHYYSETGKHVQACKDEAGCFSGDLVDKSVAFLTEKVQDSGIDCVVAVPSKRHPNLVPNFAERLAANLGLPFYDVVVKTSEGSKQQDLNNSSLKENNVRDTIAVVNADAVADKVILLVDDVVDSGWTFTVIASELLKAGAREIYPFALAKKGYAV